MSSTAPAAEHSHLELSALQQARHHHAQGHLLEAAQAYRQSLQSGHPSPLALLGLGLIARQSNQLQPALRMAQAALAADPGSSLAWANYGDILTALNQLDEAQSAYRQSLAFDPTTTAAHYGLGNALALQENFAQALASFETAALQAPNLPGFHFALAFAQSKLGHHLAAINAYRRAVELRPAFAPAWLNLGVELVADGRDELAALCYLQALQPPSAIHTQISAHLNHGHLERARGNFPAALDRYNHAFALTAPDHPRLSEVHVAFAYHQLEQQQFPAAHRSIAAAQTADPNRRNPEIPNALGILLLAEDVSLPAGMNTECPIHAAASSRHGWEGDNSRAVAAECPIHAAPSSRHGWEVENSRIEAAITAFLRAESQGHKTAASNRGNALLRLGRCTEALAAHQSALDRDPTHPGVRYNLALTQLRLGDFEHGWRNYEARWHFREVHPHPRRFPQTRWNGEPIPHANSALFLYAEQGFGDTIQFIRYLPLLAARLPGVKIIVEVQPSLTRLLNHNFTQHDPAGPIQCVAHGDHDPPTPFTHHCPLLSLPNIFQTTLQTVPANIPYLAADLQLITQRGRELAALNWPAGAPSIPRILPNGWESENPARPLHIGLSWAGNPNYRADHERSTRLETFLPLLQLPNIHLISLQKGEAATQLRDFPQVYDACSRDIDFASTAALIANLDLVITTDTAIAHLAGALGKPLWLLLPWQSDWRWMQGTPDTPWYPTARLFRQSSPNNWPELIHRVTVELRANSLTC
jgi:tetratricopeptide (TPR) repeat protein